MCLGQKMFGVLPVKKLFGVLPNKYLNALLAYQLIECHKGAYYI